MKTREALATLEQFQAWRTGGETEETEMPHPKKTTHAIDAAIALMRLLEKAESIQSILKRKARA